ncbi:S24 family peptidase [Comamonas sp. Y6]|uniref:S24 family peptidase n=1 Tax=Comamonas resistens TaxID=3046670 RepID=A0ABY8SW32_9BURK|nr:S24 family peptidase [Comamonas resistens]MDL5036818.1 S24 family peptidase [Comamonas resistens]WHS67128.1 S24 family peptidase [Comamonas resistens]
MKFGERLEAAMREMGWGPSEVAEQSGVAMPTISAIVRRASDRTNFKEDLIKAFPKEMISHAWLRDEKGSMKSDAGGGGIIALHAEDDLPEGYIRIPEYKVHFSAGPGQVVVSYELEECSEPATYRLSWLQQERLNPDKLKRFKVKNGSMEPFLFHGDSVLVNEAENTLDQVLDGKVYAIRYGNELRIKRLFYRRISGEVVLRSDNPAYKDEEVMASQFNEQISIIGRVRDKSGTGGL